jgi:hypothetical protein
VFVCTVNLYPRTTDRFTLWVRLIFGLGVVAGLAFGFGVILGAFAVTVGVGFLGLVAEFGPSINQMAMVSAKTMPTNATFNWFSVIAHHRFDPARWQALIQG